MGARLLPRTGFFTDSFPTFASLISIFGMAYLAVLLAVVEAPVIERVECYSTMLRALLLEFKFD